MRWHLILVSLLAVLVFAGVDVPTAQACSGPPTSLSRLLMADHLIQGELVTSDAARQAHIVRVTSSLYGGPVPQTILVTQNTPGQIQGLLDGRLGGGDCSSIPLAPPPDTPFYMFVSRQAYGHYAMNGGLFSPAFYVFPNAEATVPVVDNEDEEDYRSTQVTEDDFLARIAQKTGDVPAAPDVDAPPPTYAPLLVETTTGEQILIPADLAAPRDAATLETFARYLTGFLPLYMMGVNAACYDACRYYADNDWIVYRHDPGSPDVILSRYGFPIAPGETAAHSPRGDVALWQGDMLAVYRPHGVEQRYYTPETNPLDPVAMIRLSSDATPRGPNAAAWSEDSALFTYSDGDRLMLWRPFAAESAPRLIMQSDNGEPIVPLGFSHGGRYLHTISGTEATAYTVDLVDGTTYWAAALSANATYFYSLFPTTEPGFYDLITGVTGTSRTERFAPQPDVPLNLVYRAAWLGDSTLQAVFCTDITRESCAIRRFVLSHREFDNQPLFEPSGESIPGYDFLYSPYGDLAIVTDTHTVTVNGHAVALDLTGEITRMRWLPSMFYGSPGDFIRY